MRRNRRVKSISFQRELFFAGSRLHRLPIDGVQCGDEEGGENGFSHVRVRSGHEISSHRETETARALEFSLRACIIAATRLARMSLEWFAVRDKRRRADPVGTVGGR